MPYYTYLYKNDRKILEDNADAIYKYIVWTTSTRNEKGLVKAGLGDWCPVGGHNNVKASREFTGNVYFLDVLKKSAFIFGVIGENDKKEYAEKLYEDIRKCIRKEFIDPESCIADTKCQTSQAWAIYYDVFNEEEKEKAFSVLLDIIHKNDDFIDFGILGARIMFHLLCDYGEVELAYKMITRKEWPSYGHFIEQGLTSLPETFFPDYKECDSLNHHFFGDIANFFISKIAGIKYNSDGNSHSEVIIKPDFVSSLSYASASIDTPCGKVSVYWNRYEKGVSVKIEADERLDVKLVYNDNVIGQGSGKFFI